MNCNCVCKTDMHTTTVSGFAESNDVLIQHDATWIISSTFIIFTMQSGKRNNLSDAQLLLFQIYSIFDKTIIKCISHTFSRIKHPKPHTCKMLFPKH